MKFVGLLLAVHFLFTQNTALAGRDSELSLEFSAQEQSNWCWASAAIAVLSATGKSARQCEMVSFTLGYRTDYCCKQENVTACNKTHRVAPVLSSYGIRMKSSGSLTIADVQNTIEGGSPVILTLTMSTYSHYVVAYGVSAEGRMKIWDPGNGGKHKHYTHGELETAYQGRWIESLVPSRALSGAVVSSRPYSPSTNDVMRESRNTLEQLKQIKARLPAPDSMQKVMQEIQELKQIKARQADPNSMQKVMQELQELKRSGQVREFNFTPEQSRTLERLRQIYK